VKPEHRFCGNANAIMRHNTEHEGTCRRTGSIDDDFLVRVAQRHVARPIDTDIAAAVIRYAHDRSRSLWQQLD
jgi:hypothetical protein